MIFSSMAFMAFFALYLLMHFLLPSRHRALLIIAGSFVFYCYYFWIDIWIPLALTLVAYMGAHAVSRAPKGSFRQKALLLASITLLLAPLLVYNYTSFFYNSLAPFIAGSAGPMEAGRHPIGVSFITFTVIAYVVDTYYGRQAVESSFKALLAYVMFFPKLLAGPITRAPQTLARITSESKARKGWILAGAWLFTVGFAKKGILADPIAEFVDRVFEAAPLTLGALDYLSAIYGYSIQIYCDFSGYTDMALGVALVLGVRLPINFRQPYLATSFVDFWKRWHLTLSSWLRDYLYIPLGGNRRGFLNQARNVFITMFLGGLWHGAGWTFVAWGVFHALGIITWHAFRRFAGNKMLSKIPRWVSILLTFNLVTVCWVFFRAPDFSTALMVLSGPFRAPLGDIAGFASGNLFILFIMLAFAITHRLDDYRRIVLFSRRRPAKVVIGLIVFIAVLTITLGSGNSRDFIYFDF